MSEQEVRIQEITQELRTYGNDSAFPYGLDRSTALEAANLLETLLHAQQARGSMEKLIGYDADATDEAAMRTLIKKINAKNLGVGIDYSADKDVLCVAFLYGKQASYAIQAIEEKMAREKPEPMTVLDDLCATWKLEPQILAGMLVIYHCTYDGCVSYELPFNMGYERTRPEAIKRTVKYLTSPYTEPKGEQGK